MSWFQKRLAELGVPSIPQRKVWELAVITQVALERLGGGGTACGFGVAREPLPAWLAAYGAEVCVTNLASSDPVAQAWAAAGQHARGLEDLVYPHVVDHATFFRQCRWRDVDMRALPADLGQYDFLWSTCAMEHLASRAAGLQFVCDAARHLAPGGWAVHTTEFCTSSATATLDNAGTVLFVESDLLGLSERLAQNGITLLPLDLAPGTGEWDQYVDRPPYQGPAHLNVQFQGFVTTCVALIMTREA